MTSRRSCAMFICKHMGAATGRARLHDQQGVQRRMTDTTTSATSAPLDLITIGRVGVDLYPLQDGVGLEEVETFGKYLGGSAAERRRRRRPARHSARAVVTAHRRRPVRPVRHAASSSGSASTTGSSRTVADLQHARHVLRDLPARRLPPLLLPRAQGARPGASNADELDLDAITRRPHLLGHRHRALARTRAAPPTTPPGRPAARTPLTVLDLDYRPMFWSSPDGRAAARSRRALEHVTVAVGNREECEIAVGETDPHRAADALLDRGVELAIVKQGPQRRAREDPRRDRGGAAVLRRGRQRARRGRRLRRRALPRPARRLVARDGSSASPTSPARSSPAAASARPPCRRPPRSTTILEEHRPCRRLRSPASSPRRPPPRRLRARCAHARAAIPQTVLRRVLAARARRPLVARRRPPVHRRRRPPRPRRARRPRRPDGHGRPLRAARPPRDRPRRDPASTACSARPTSSRTSRCSALLDDKVVVGSMNRGGLTRRRRSRWTTASPATTSPAIVARRPRLRQAAGADQPRRRRAPPRPSRRPPGRSTTAARGAAADHARAVHQPWVDGTDRQRPHRPRR